MSFLLLLIFHIYYATSRVLAKLPTSCPITDQTTIVYSLADGVGPASKIWVEDLLYWWKFAVNENSRIFESKTDIVEYMGLTGTDLQNCQLAEYPNLRVYINPGGDAYDQLTSLGEKGTQHIKDFVNRDQDKYPSAYVGFCAGGYIASHSYLWETMYEGPGYYNFATNPPLAIFPHIVEGSIVDVNDDQFGDQTNSKYRAVNVSNGHTMIYYGGSTFGWNGTPDYADKKSPEFDPLIEVLLYFSDFFGFQTVNVPAAWRYNHNIVLTSVHPEADNCTTEQNYDCPPAGSLSIEHILQNRAWITQYINEAAQATFPIPEVPLPPNFNTTKPHDVYPEKSCYEDEQVLFCDDFDSEAGFIPTGLSPQFQRNQTNYYSVEPWNTSYISTWNDGVFYADPFSGNGYAVNVPKGAPIYSATITSKGLNAGECGRLLVSFAHISRISLNGFYSFEYSVDGVDWALVASLAADSESQKGWVEKKLVLESEGARGFLRFVCGAGEDIKEFCGLDSLMVKCLV